MTLIIIFAVITAIGGVFLFWASKDGFDSSFKLITGVSLLAFGIIMLIIVLLFYPLVIRENTVIYQQLLEEKKAIEYMLDNADDFDRIMLSQKVMDYNNRVILVKARSSMPISKEYHAESLDWQGLELIEWR